MKKRHGFTLVELLTVIIIISLLAGMISGAAYYAVTSVNQSVIRQEISQLELALNAYKAEFGEYPPDGTNSTDVANHIQRCYPNATTTSTWCTVNPSTALVVFLGPRNADPKNPFGSNPYSENISLTKPFFEFDETRLENNAYKPRGCTTYYLYRKAKLSKGKGYYPSYSEAYAYMYLDNDGNKKWYNDTTFQIISSGLDNDFGLDNATLEDLNSTGTAAKGVKIAEGAVPSALGNNITNFAPRQIKDLLD
ncbi:MAG: type II secretion system protein [Planctomycetia bacterium]|nr:type II secretion system protein [Planctomycetia bacterium]